MPVQRCSRRGFLASGLLAAFSLGLPYPGKWVKTGPIALGRVTVSYITIFKRPSFTSEPLGRLFRDELLSLLEGFHSSAGPEHNPTWYRVKQGFIHSGYVQRVDFRPVNTPLSSVPERGLWGEVTVPYTQTFFEGKSKAWEPLYRLYYESIHWVRGVFEGPDGAPWYRLFDPKNDSTYYVRAADIRILPPDLFNPIARDVPWEKKRIAISIASQTLTAFEGDRIVLHTSISSGVPSQDVPEGEIPTDTPIGYWRITQKMASRHMGDGRLTSEIEAYELPGVPWTMAFHETGAAMHGSYWHDNFGIRMSHGCVNMRNSEALWLFRWTDPVFDPGNWYTNGLGTLVQVK